MNVEKSFDVFDTRNVKVKIVPFEDLTAGDLFFLIWQYEGIQYGKDIPFDYLRYDLKNKTIYKKLCLFVSRDKYFVCDTKILLSFHSTPKLEMFGKIYE